MADRDGVKRSKVKKRLLDPRSWRVTHYDDATVPAYWNGVLRHLDSQLAYVLGLTRFYSTVSVPTTSHEASLSTPHGRIIRQSTLPVFATSNWRRWPLGKEMR